MWIGTPEILYTGSPKKQETPVTIVSYQFYYNEWWHFSFSISVKTNQFTRLGGKIGRERNSLEEQLELVDEGSGPQVANGSHGLLSGHKHLGSLRIQSMDKQS